jgi:L,D-transpeptidase YcbB
MHDTIKRGLFNYKARAEGHNCPRVANPEKFAAVLLAEDKGWEASKIDKLVAEGNNTKIDLGHPIPVHTTYFTALVDDEGKVETFDDVYKLDDIVAAAIKGNGTKPDAADDEARAEPPKPDTGGSVADSTP